MSRRVCCERTRRTKVGAGFSAYAETTLALAVTRPLVVCSRRAMLLVLWTLVMMLSRAGAAEVFRDCGGVLRGPRGVISTPGFPGPYPIPIACRWVLEAAPGQRVALYLTQFYMREGVTVSEYVFYSDEQLNMGGTQIGSISSESEPTHVLSNKPVMVIDFQVS